MFVSIVHLVETDNAVQYRYCYTCRTIIVSLQSPEKSVCEREFAINVHAIDKITKFATQIYCTANRQAEPLSARACLWVGRLVPGKYNRNSD